MDKRRHLTDRERLELKVEQIREDNRRCLVEREKESDRIKDEERDRLRREEEFEQLREEKRRMEEEEREMEEAYYEP